MASKLRIAVNTRLLLRDRMEGMGYFAYEILMRITRSHPEVEFHFLFDRPYDESFIFSDNVKPVVLFPQARHPFLWYWWFEWSVASYLKRGKFDLFLSPDGFGCLRSETPQLVVLHDIAFEHYPDYVPALASRYYKYYTPRFVSHAVRVATVSEYSKSDIIKHYGCDPGKIDVVYNAAKDIFQALSLEDKVRIADQYTEGKPYLIYVGSIHPRKNLRNMLLAFDAFKKANPSSTLKFLVVGAYGWQYSDIQQLIDTMSSKGEVVFLGRQPLEELARLIAASYALMYLSVFEGFGVPPIEGMACGVPVIASDTSSIPEICGDAALLTDPLDVSAISSCIERLWTDHALYHDLIAKGHVQAAKYSWDRCAQLLWDSCLKAVDHPLR
jgi:glycosyltransferase involved in cell wall biosynthesis